MAKAYETSMHFWGSWREEPIQWDEVCSRKPPAINPAAETVLAETKTTLQNSSAVSACMLRQTSLDASQDGCACRRFRV